MTPLENEPETMNATPARGLFARARTGRARARTRART